MPVNEVHYYDLPATNDHHCEVMLPNRMQCTNRAAIAIVPNKDVEPSVNQASYHCNYHFTVERALNQRDGVKYVYHDSTGKEASDIDKEYVPRQK